MKFLQDSEHVNIYFNNSLRPGVSKNITINYSGIPSDGLIIDTNKFARRTFFSDNWPNRAHNWIPCNDHPSDKASVEFLVTTPDHYRVIANGILIKESDLPDHLKFTHWKEDLALPTKIMAIGVADFDVQLVANVNGIPSHELGFSGKQGQWFFAIFDCEKNPAVFYELYRPLSL